MMNKLFYATAILCGLVWFCIILDHLSSIPEVQFSYSTGECVNVMNFVEPYYSCDKLPEKFIHVWVK
jgi:hypothetical protein